MWMICATSRLNEKPSFDRTRIDDSRWSYWCASLRCAQLSTMFVVGTSSTFITRVLIGCLPGRSASFRVVGEVGLRTALLLPQSPANASYRPEFGGDARRTGRAARSATRRPLAGDATGLLVDAQRQPPCVSH